MISLKYNGHANFSINKDDMTILIDPFFNDNQLIQSTPMKLHYDTWPLIAQSPEEFKKDVEANCDFKVNIVKFGETIQF